MPMVGLSISNPCSVKNYYHISTLFIARADERPSLSQKADNYNCFALCTGKYDLYFVCIGQENFNLSQAEFLCVLEYVYAVIQTNETLI